MSIEGLILSKINFQQLASEAIQKIDTHEVVTAAINALKNEAELIAHDPAKQQQLLQSVAKIESEAETVIAILKELHGIK